MFTSTGATHLDTGFVCSAGKLINSAPVVTGAQHCFRRQRSNQESDCTVQGLRAVQKACQPFPKGHAQGRQKNGGCANQRFSHQSNVCG